MSTTYEQLMQLEFPELHDSYSEKDTMLYALSLGVGTDPTDADELQLVYEKNLCALPTMCVTLAHPGFWPKELNTGLDFSRIVHGAQRLRMHSELSTSGSVIGRSRIRDVIDKGEGRGALVYFQRELYSAEDDRHLCSMEQTLFCRGDGGMGGSGHVPQPPHAIPEREPDYQVPHEVPPQCALLYRLNGDMNPLHADPEIASRAGFDRPILQGLASYALAGLAIIKSVCGNDPTRLLGLDVRFTAPVYPGEILLTQIWQENSTTVSVRVLAPDRGVVAIDNANAVLA